MGGGGELWGGCQNLGPSPPGYPPTPTDQPANSLSFLPKYSEGQGSRLLLHQRPSSLSPSGTAPSSADRVHLTQGTAGNLKSEV